MPYIYDMSQTEWREDDIDFEPPSPKVAEFQYLRPPQFGGAKSDPVHFTVPKAPPAGPADLPQQRSVGLFGRILGWLGVNGGTSSATYYDYDDAKVMALLYPKLVECGGAQAYCRYDGGNDEGFAWLDSVTMQSGEKLDAQAIASRLADTGAADALTAAGLMRQGGSTSVQKQLSDMIRYSLCDSWAAVLLGQGYGTGEYAMYGAFIVDLSAQTITDDPNAAAIVENIEIDTTDT